MTPTQPERPAEEPGRGEQNELGYRDVDEERGYDETGDQSPPGEDPAREDDDQP